MPSTSASCAGGDIRRDSDRQSDANHDRLPTRHRNRGRCAVRAALLALLLCAVADLALAAAVPPPFQSGERLTFVLKWTIIPAGEAVLTVMPREAAAGQPNARHFQLTARSNAFVDAFYMVRDRIDAWAGSDGRQSLLYRQQQHEGRTRRDITVIFDWETMTARYTNKGQAREPLAITAGTLDPLSIFYWFRALDLSVGKDIQRPVTDGKKHIMGKARVIRRERVKVPAGTFDAFLVEPDLTHVGGVFEKSPDAKIALWVSADRRRLPLKLKSKVIVGSFTGELVDMTGTVPPASSAN